MSGQLNKPLLSDAQESKADEVSISVIPRSRSSVSLEQLLGLIKVEAAVYGYLGAKKENGYFSVLPKRSESREKTLGRVRDIQALSLTAKPIAELYARDISSRERRVFYLRRESDWFENYGPYFILPCITLVLTSIFVLIGLGVSASTADGAFRHLRDEVLSDDACQGIFPAFERNSTDIEDYACKTLKPFVSGNSTSSDSAFCDAVQNECVKYCVDVLSALSDVACTDNAGSTFSKYVIGSVITCTVLLPFCLYQISKFQSASKFHFPPCLPGAKRVNAPILPRVRVNDTAVSNFLSGKERVPDVYNVANDLD